MQNTEPDIPRSEVNAAAPTSDLAPPEAPDTALSSTDSAGAEGKSSVNSADSSPYLFVKELKSYGLLQKIAALMDKYLLDPLIGLIPGFGDLLSATCGVIPLYLTLFKMRSLSLSLAVIFNLLGDVLLGLLPFWVGDLIDVFNRGYKRSLKLVTGFAEGDAEVIAKVKRRAWFMALLIALCVLGIYLLLTMMGQLYAFIKTLLI
ncbi:MAG: DUF4112 domain-containing protein [Succinivibrio sp.]|nr:DUF4112 domain-containing protein [Succinivibrio sp.]